MRQNNQNKRMRGRSRKGPNPLSRSYESNGPDVKIRGTALHVAEKYVQLARDAQASGDRVIAENYLQHAEHYFRIVAAAQGQTPQQGQSQSAPQRDEPRDGEAAPAAIDQPAETVMPADAPQPFVDAMPGINSKTSNGSGRPSKSGAEASAEGGNGAEPASADGDSAQDDAQKPRRRVRGTRGRGTKRSAPDETGAEAAEPSAAETATETSTETPVAADTPVSADTSDVAETAEPETKSVPVADA